MKKLIFFVVFLIFAFVMNAQDNKTTFSSLDRAKEAYVIGTYSYYTPIDISRFKEVSAEEDTVSFSRDVAVRMNVVGGTFWIIQKARTKFVEKNKKIVRLYECGNKISGFSSLPLAPPPITMLSQVQIPGPKGEKGDRGERGLPGKNGNNAEVSSNWLLWTGIVAAIVTAVVAIFLPRHHDTIIPIIDNGGTGPGGYIGPAFKRMPKN